MKVVFKICRKTILWSAEIAGGLLLLVAVGSTALLWRLSSGPVDLTFAANNIKSSLVREDEHTQFVFKSIVAEWPSFDGPVLIGLSGVELREDGKPVLDIPKLGIRLAKAPLMIGLIKPEAVTVTNPTIRMLLSNEGKLHMLVASTESAETNIQTSSSSEAKGFDIKAIGESFFKGGNLPDYPALAPLSRIEKVTVKDAQILVDDERLKSEWALQNVNFDLGRKTDSFTVDLSYGQPGQIYVADSAAHVVLNLARAEDGAVTLKSKINNVDAALFGQIIGQQATLGQQHFILNGNVDGDLTSNWDLRSLKAHLSSGAGVAEFDGLLSKPLTISNLDANIDLDAANKTLSITDTNIDVNGSTIALSGTKTLSDDDPYFPLTVSIPSVTFDQIHDLWPDDQKDTILAEWITHKLSKATITDLALTLPINVHDPEDVPAEKIEASFKYSNLSADYRAPMIPAENASGSGTIKGDVLDILVDKGNIADMTIKKGRVNITHLTHPTIVGDVTIDAELSGNLSTVMDYISREPVNLGEKVGMKKEAVRGKGDMKVNVVFPALKDLPANQVVVKVDATLTDILFPGIVRGLDLSGGPFKLNVAGGAFDISGKGKLDGKDIDLYYSEYLATEGVPYQSKIKASLNADKKLRDTFGVHIDQFITGSAPVTIEYLEEKPGEATIDVVVDATPSAVKVDPIGYLKPAGTKASATAKVLIKNHDVSSINDLTITASGGVSAKGNIVFGKVGSAWDVSQVNFSSVKIGTVADFALKLLQKDADVYDAVITGKAFDARKYVGGSDDPEQKSADTKETYPVVAASVNVARLVTGDEDRQYLSNASVKVNTNRDGDITYLDMTGNTPNGNVSASIKPDANKSMGLMLKASNAGEALDALDIYNNMRGGKLLVKGTQVAGGGINDMVGRGVVTNFSVVKAPVLAKFINLFSLSGLTELLQNKGIEFTRLRTDFEWKEKNGERLIILNKGKTSGASIGLSFEGIINQTQSKMDLKGTVVPMSGVNSVVSNIPLIGNLLTGGKNGGLIAATYTMKGNSEDPTVFINPLSVLAPGFLRSILFEGDTDFEDDSDISPKENAAGKDKANSKSRFNQ